tara:strand:+ start:781 stop:936 length:156 start_codon:yes stop_codon:yes gene_type:complete
MGSKPQRDCATFSFYSYLRDDLSAASQCGACPMKKILVTVDFSDASITAVR